MLKAVRTALVAPRRSARVISAGVAALVVGSVLAAAPATAATATSPDATPVSHHAATVARKSAAQTAHASQATFGARVIAEAARHDGAWYSYGSAGPYTFDCSGFTSYVYRQLGVYLPRTSYSQYAYVQHISRANALPGDLVFMSGLGHVGIYAGNGMMWDAPTTGQQVHERPIYDSGYLIGRVSR